MNLYKAIEDFIQDPSWLDTIQPATILMKAYTHRANLKNKLYQIELNNIDPTSKAALEKQQMQIAKENEEYRQAQMELELINAGIRALEIYLKIYELKEKR